MNLTALILTALPLILALGLITWGAYLMYPPAAPLLAGLIIYRELREAHKEKSP